MGKGKRDILVELQNSKKKLIDFLWRKEKSIYDIRKNLNISQRRVNQIVTELNHAGLFMFHDNNDGVRMVKLEKDNIIVKHETEKFIPDLSLMLVILALSAITSAFILFSYKVLLWGIFSTGMMFIYILYKIFRTPDITRFFYKTARKKTNREGVFPKS